MTVYQDIDALLETPKFRAQAKIALLNVGKDILIEDGSTPNHANRSAWTLGVIADPEAAVDKAIAAFATDSVVEANASDPDGLTDEEVLGVLTTGVVNMLANIEAAT